MTRRRWVVAVIVVAVAGASGVVVAASRKGPTRACGLVGEAGPDLAARAPGDTVVDGRYAATVPAPVGLPAEPAPRWSVSLSSLGLAGADIVTGGSVVLAVTEREVVALTAADGIERWRVRCDDSVTPSVRAATLGTTVVVDIGGPDDNVVCGLDAGTGRRRWCRAGSLLEDGWDGTTVVVVHDDGDDVGVSAIDVATGDAAWRQRRPDGVVHASADLVVVDRPGDELDLIDRATGDVLETRPALGGEVVLAGDTVATVTAAAVTAAETTITGEVPATGERWRVDLLGVAGDLEPAGNGIVVGARSDTEPVSRLVSGGELHWSGDLFPIGSVRDAAGSALLAKDSTQLALVDIATGTVRWTLDGVAVPEDAVAVADGVVYSILVDYGADTATLAAFDLGNGTPLWRHPLERDDGLAGLVAMDGGLVVVNSDQLEAYA